MKALIVGDSCNDKFTYGSAERLCPDVPAPVFSPLFTSESSGMAGNVYNNFKAIGASCELVTNEEEITKHRYVDSKTNHTFLRVDSPLTCERISEERLSSVLSYIDKFDAVAVSDYGKGFLLEEDIRKICESHDKVFLDTKKTIGDWCKDVAFIKINTPEFEATRESIEGINSKKWANKLIVTRGGLGCMMWKETGFNYYPTKKVDVFDLSGAGDTFLCCLMYDYIKSNDINSAIEFANECSSFVVQKKGVSTITKKDLLCINTKLN